MGDSLVAAIVAGRVFSSVDFGNAREEYSFGLPGWTVRAFHVVGDFLLAGISDSGVYRLPLDQLTDVADVGGEVPAEYQLAQNYPNRFNPATTIVYGLPKGSYVNLRVFNAIGQEVRTLVAGERSAGTHTIVWDASGLPSGVYFYRLAAGDFVATKTTVLMK